MTRPSGIGIENYNWYMKNVHLVPYTWVEQVAILRRELTRAWAFLRLEEIRNVKLPPLAMARSVEEYGRRYRESVREFMAFLRAKDLFTVLPYQGFGSGTIGFSQSVEPVDFFLQVEYRSSLPLLCHGMHACLISSALAKESHPIRSVPCSTTSGISRREGRGHRFRGNGSSGGIDGQGPRGPASWFMSCSPTGRLGHGRPDDARQPFHPRGSGRLRLPMDAQRMAAAGPGHGLDRHAHLSPPAVLRSQLRHRKSPDRPVDGRHGRRPRGQVPAQGIPGRVPGRRADSGLADPLANDRPG
ncbi:MAG: hypothetical protein MZV63_46940 [Marinilabiliales bacterium]|nr:hypothetical protein [Marinilabiliales bacterium]